MPPHLLLSPCAHSSVPSRPPAACPRPRLAQAPVVRVCGGGNLTELLLQLLLQLLAAPLAHTCAHAHPHANQPPLTHTHTHLLQRVLEPRLSGRVRQRLAQQDCDLVLRRGDALQHLALAGWRTWWRWQGGAGRYRRHCACMHPRLRAWRVGSMIACRSRPLLFTMFSAFFSPRRSLMAPSSALLGGADKTCCGGARWEAGGLVTQGAEGMGAGRDPQTPQHPPGNHAEEGRGGSARRRAADERHAPQPHVAGCHDCARVKR